MIKVNLLATVPGAAPPRDWIPREQRSALIGLGMLVATAIAVGGWWFYLSSVRADLNARVATQEAALVRFKEAAKLVEQTTSKKTELTERLSVIERLRAAKREPVSLLETVSRSVPDGLWLLEIKQTGVSIQAEGRAMSLTAVTDFAEQLQSSGMFERPVEILTTTTEVLEDITVVRFAVKAQVVQSAVPGEPSAASNAVATNSVARTGA